MVFMVLSKECGQPEQGSRPHRPGLASRRSKLGHNFLFSLEPVVKRMAWVAAVRQPELVCARFDFPLHPQMFCRRKGGLLPNHQTRRAGIELALRAMDGGWKPFRRT